MILDPKNQPVGVAAGKPAPPPGFSYNADGSLVNGAGQPYVAPTTPPNNGKAPAGQEYGPTGQLQPLAAPTNSLLPSTSTPGVITSQGAQTQSSPSSLPASGNVPPQPGIGIAGQAFTQPIPQPPSMSAILASSNIPQMQSYLSNIQQSQMALQNAYKAYTLGINGQGTPAGIVDALGNEQAKNMQIQMDTLNQQEALASSQLSNAMTYVNMAMTAQGTDYQNAIKAYDDQFTRAYQIQTMYNQTATQEQNNASAYLNTVGSMIGTSGINWDTVSPSMKATVQAMEAQAGWPEGTLQSFAKIKPGSNILSTVNGVDPNTGQNAVTFLYSNPDGSPGMMQSVVLPTKPVSLFSNYSSTSSGSTSSNGYTGSILQGTGIDPQAKVSDILGNPTQTQALFGAMTAAEGGPNAAGSQYNNPLDLKYTPAMASWGATDSGVKAQDGGTFAAFPDAQTAQAAYAKQLSQPGYAGLTLDQALQKWSGYKAPANSSTPSVDPTVKSYADQVMNGTITSITGVPNTGSDRGLRDAVSRYIDTADIGQFTPLAVRRYTMDSNAIVANYITQSSYTVMNNALPFLSRIDAASKNPGSISDQELLDSLTKIDTGGGVISDAQVKLITDGQSYKDSLSVLNNKLSNGGVLSNSQRQQMQDLAHAVYQGYQKIYQPVYNAATAQLTAAGIPKPFWTIPDLNNLSASAGYPSASDAKSSSTNSGSTTSGTTSSGVSWSIIQ